MLFELCPKSVTVDEFLKELLKAEKMRRR